MAGSAAPAFRLAPMTWGVRLSTSVVFVLPLLPFIIGWSLPPEARRVMFLCAGLAALVLPFTWLFMRPSHFVVDDVNLTMLWPLRSRLVPRASIAGAETIASAEFRRTYGVGVRIGVGGLWGAFGLLQTNRETFSMWISGRDGLVIVRLTGGQRPLLLTPDDPGRFVAALGFG